MLAFTMSTPVSRRKALELIGAATAGAVLAPAVLRGQSSSILVNGKPVEIAIASVSASTVRISVLPIATTPANVRNDGALVAAATGRALGRRRVNFTPVTAGNLVVRFGTDSRTLHVDTLKGVPVQQLTLDPKSPVVTFALGKGPLFGLGEGVMRAYSRMIAAGSFEAVTKTSKSADDADDPDVASAGVSVPVGPVRSNAPSARWMNMPQPSVLTNHRMGTRPPCVRSW